MELSDTTSLLLRRAINGSALRQETLAGNLANANTPGYQRRDVDFQGTLRAALHGDDVRSAVTETSFAAGPDGSGAVRPDGNGVDVDTEAARLAQNGLLYQALLAVSRGRGDALRSAIGGPS
jgi:flagellar basal-body rod protein FlgB